MRILFFGTPRPAAATLDALVGAGHDIVAVVTQPDKRRGRGSGTAPSPVRAVADLHGLPVWTPTRAREVIDQCRAVEAELGVVVAFGQLLPRELLDVFPKGCLNVHYSLLPRWRGAAPVERAILAGDEETGITIMGLDEGLDTGPVFATAPEPIRADDTSGALLDRLTTLGSTLLIDTLANFEDCLPRAQEGTPTYADKLTVDEFALNWARPANELARIVRAGTPRPGAWTTVDGTRVKVIAATAEGHGRGDPGVVAADGAVQTGDGLLRLHVVQPEGKRPMDVGPWLAGRRGAATVLGT